MTPHILFVDDEAPIRELLSIYFRKKGIEVTTTTTVEEAKMLAAEAKFSLAILDVDLAGENGLDLLIVFKSKYPSMPVIMFTGLNADKGVVERARASGADGFTRKTESLHDLFAEVSRHLPQGGAKSQV